MPCTLEFAGVSWHSAREQAAGAGPHDGAAAATHLELHLVLLQHPPDAGLVRVERRAGDLGGFALLAQRLADLLTEREEMVAQQGFHRACVHLAGHQLHGLAESRKSRRGWRRGCAF